jgi:hypothetical protein
VMPVMNVAVSLLGVKTIFVTPMFGVGGDCV